MSIKHLNTVFMISWSVGEIYSFKYFWQASSKHASKIMYCEPWTTKFNSLKIFHTLCPKQLTAEQYSVQTESAEEKVICNDFGWMNEAAQVCNLQ